MIFDKLSAKSDTLGAISSSLCLIHCVATPIIFMMSPLSTQVESTPVWWKSLDYVFLLFSFFAVHWSTKNTSKNWVKTAFWVTLAALTLAILNEKFEVFHWPVLTIYIPAVLLIILHVYNRKYCQCSDDKCCANG